MVDDILISFNGWFTNEIDLDTTASVEDIDPPTETFLSNSELSQVHDSHSYSENISTTIAGSDFNLSEPFDNRSISEERVEIDSLGELFGNPSEHSEFWRQQTGSNSCAVVAQTSIYESITGVCIPEDRACEIAEQSGCFNSEIGTLPGDVGKFLNHLGIPTEQKYNANLEDIATALEKGERVIVGLDANEIWTPMRDANGIPIEQTNAGHAVWVTGIDTQPDGTVKIMLNDSGHPHGKMAVVDAVDFLHAWEDYSNLTTITTISDRTIPV
jgi:hypothetical protein